MRIHRALIAAMAVAAALPQVGTAQMGRSFKDSWFWGVKGGGMDFNSMTMSHQQAPLIGGDWLITRSRGGLYVSFTQAFLTDQAAIQLDPADTSLKIVGLKNMRRLDAAAMIFPGMALFTRPYAGIGFSIKQINNAMPADLSQYASPDELAETMSVITQLRTSASPFFIAGAQFRLPLISIFFQGTASPANKNGFLYNGKAFHLTYEAGIRYNVGTSIDRN